jgi:hypothetical protein
LLPWDAVRSTFVFTCSGNIFTGGYVQTALDELEEQKRTGK